MGAFKDWFMMEENFWRPASSREFSVFINMVESNIFSIKVSGLFAITLGLVKSVNN